MIRARGYVRESTVRQGDKYGPDAQRTAIVRAAAELGLEVPDRYYVDLVSGTGALKRSDFQRMVEDARARAFDVLVVYDTSRFARNEADAFTYQAALAAAGVRIYYVMERAWSDEEDRAVVVGMQHVLNADYSRRLRKKIRDGYEAKWAKHAMPGGRVPWGYRGVDQMTRLELDPAAAPTRALVFELYGAGTVTTASLARELNDRGHTLAGRPFTRWNVHDILRNPIAMGQVRRFHGTTLEDHRDDAVTPIVTRELWERCQRLLSSRRHAKGSMKRHTFVFSSRSRHVCGAPIWGSMQARESGAERRLIHARGRECGVPFQRREAVIEEAFATWLGTWRLDARRRTKLAARLARPVVERDVAAERKTINARMARAKQLFLLGDMAESAYLAERQTAQRAIDDLPVGEISPAVITELMSAGAAFAAAPIPARRAFVEELLEAIVFDGELVTVVVRPRYRGIVAAIAAPEVTVKRAQQRAAGGRWGGNAPRGASGGLGWIRPLHTHLTVDSVTLALRQEWLATEASA